MRAQKRSNNNNVLMVSKVGWKKKCLPIDCETRSCRILVVDFIRVHFFIAILAKLLYIVVHSANFGKVSRYITQATNYIAISMENN